VEDVARWMLAELPRRGGVLDYATAALEIVRLFGGAFCHPVGGREFAISPEVVAAFDAFAAVAPEEIVWNEEGRRWIMRSRADAPYR
jgi:hypothetical protein